MSRTRPVEQHPGGRRTAFPWIQAVFLMGIWLLFSGKLDAFHVGAGVAAVLVVIWLDRKLGPANLGREDLPIRPNIVRYAIYFPWLILQMMLSSWQVAKIILHPRASMNPVLVRFTSPQPHTIARVVLGNSITLTPGTLTLDIDGDRYLVHSLSDDSTEGLLKGRMQKRIARMFNAEEYGSVSDAEVVKGEIRGGIAG